MNRVSYFLVASLLLCVCDSAQAIIPEGKPPFIVGPARDPLTLEQALKKAPPSQSQVTLAVGAEGLYLPQEAPLPASEARAPSIAAAFGFLAKDFHDVTAIAPATMTVLNTNPGKPDPYDGMPSSDAFKMLLGALSDDQWKLLTGKRGLSVSDLVTEEQKALYRAMFPDGVVSFIPRKGGFAQFALVEPPPKLEMSELLSGRLRLTRRTEISIPIVGDPNTSIGASAPVTGAPEFAALGGNSGEGPHEKVYGATLRATVPNVLKKSDLSDEGDAFSAAIDLTNVSTVGDLVTRIGVATHTELYADGRYEKQRVTLLGPQSARARDLLRALALCVRGTYRKVGPAYVLTNDLRGSGTRRMILTRFAQQAEMERKAAIAAAGDRAIQRRATSEETMLSDALTMTDAQKKAALAEPGYIPGADLSSRVPLSALTPGQQQLVQSLVRDWNDTHKVSTDPQNPSTRLTTETTIWLSATSTVLLDTEALHGTVVMDSYLGVQEALRPSSKLQEEFWQKRGRAEAQKYQEEQAAKPAAPAPPPPAPALKAAFAHFGRRAVIAQPRTAAEVDHLISQVKAIGFNELWLDVFSQGQSHLSGSPDILTEALAKAQGAGVSIVPILTPLDWGADAPKELQDRTLLGENSAQAGAWGQHYQDVANQNSETMEAPSEVFVSPAAPMVADTVTNLIAHISATPGVGAVAVRAKAPLGYEWGNPFQDRTLGYTLGFTEPLRLAFLRSRHVDPIDMDPDADAGPAVSALFIPEFRDYALEGAGRPQWDEYLAAVFSDFMRRLLASAKSDAGRPLGLLVPAQGSVWDTGWYGLWEDPQKPLPRIVTAPWNGGDAERTAVDASKQSRLNLKAFSGDVTDSPTQLLEALQAMKPHWDGFVIDLTDGNANDATLAALAKSLHSAPKTAAPKG